MRGIASFGIRVCTWSMVALALAAAPVLGDPVAPTTPAADTPGSEVARVVERHSPPSGAPFLGPADAPNTLILFLDYQCSVCPRAEAEMDRLVQEMDGALRIEFRQNPLPMHAGAFAAAVSAKAAQRQGKFWEYHDLLLRNRRWDDEGFVALARRVGCDADAFRRDLADPGLAADVRADAALAQAAGARGTPGFAIADYAVSGWASYEWLLQIVRERLRDPAPAPGGKPAVPAPAGS